VFATNDTQQIISLAAGLVASNEVGALTLSNPQNLSGGAVPTLLAPSTATVSVIDLSGNAWSYPGIPYPTENVPSAMMPTIPTGADLAAFPYDPCTLQPPVAPSGWPSSEVANYYYVDRFHGSATDSSNLYGYPDRPRSSIPSGASGSSAVYVEIHGNNSTFSPTSPDYDIGTTGMSMVGTPAQPVFWQGVDAPWLGDVFETTGQHIIIDSIHMQSTGSPLIPHISVDAGTKYFTFRNGTLRGTGGAITGGTGQIVTIGGSSGNPTEFIVIYNSDVFGGGDWENEHDKDIHGLRPLYYNRYNWFINNRIYHLQGDCCQTGNSSNSSTDPAQRSHYIYMAGNELYETFENALDNKNSYHVIFSSNEVYGFGVHGPGTAVIASNNDEGALTGYHWIINNEIYGSTGGAIRYSGDQTGEKTYAVGNWIHDVDGGLRFSDHSGVRNNDEWAVHNTITNCTGGAMESNRGDGQNLYISANITYDPGGAHIETQDFVVSTLSYHMSYNSNSSATGVSESNFDTAIGNQIDVDPVFTAPGSDNFSLQTGSPAIGAIPIRDPLFDVFESMYGVSIATDIAGVAIPTTNVTIGAYQRLAATNFVGFGTITNGADDYPGGATVVHVTNLNDSGAGSFREAIDGDGRYIVFDVGGTINVLSTLRISKSFITVDGLSAPSPGITFDTPGQRTCLEAQNSIAVHDIIMHNIRTVGDGVKIETKDIWEIDGSSNAAIYNVIFDHMTMTAAGDGSCDIYGEAHHITLSNCLLDGNLVSQHFSESSTARDAITMYRNVWHNNNERQPKIRYNTTRVDLVNNVCHGWGYREGGASGLRIEVGGSSYSPSANVENNIYHHVSGLSGSEDNALDIVGALDGDWYFNGNDWPAGESQGDSASNSAQIAIPAEYQVIRLATSALATEVVPNVGTHYPTAAETALLATIAGAI